MNTIVAEFIGSCLLIMFGNGVVANVVLEKSKGQNSGWVVISLGWAMAVFIAVFCVGKYSGAHLNPAVSLAMAMMGKLNWSQLPFYIAAQISGCMAGASLVWLTYRDHFKATQDADGVQACFCTSPAITNHMQNYITESLASMAFVLGVLLLSGPEQGLGSLDALPVALLVLGVGLSLGGPTGYAINPARDMGPRIAYSLLPIGSYAKNHWKYAWVPVAGPLTGAVIAVYIHTLIFAI